MLALIFTMLVSLSPQQEDASKFMREIWSPYCKGNSLLECPSSKAEELREEIYDRMQRGENRETIMKALQERYGNTLSMTPSHQGREGWAHRLPWIFTGLGVIFVAIFWLTRTKKSVERAKPQIDDKMKERILKELQDRQG